MGLFDFDDDEDRGLFFAIIYALRAAGKGEYADRLLSLAKLDARIDDIRDEWKAAVKAGKGFIAASAEEAEIFGKPFTVQPDDAKNIHRYFKKAERLFS